jgi:hypothetical protein
MMTDQKFLESITESFKKFISAGSSASTMKLKPLHGAIAKDIADRLGEDYEIKSQGYGNGKEANVMGAYTDKNVDITIYDKRSDSDKPIAGISVKFVMQNYKQNSKNYFHDMIGETANLRSAGIQYFNVFISLDTLPYYKDDDTLGTKIIHHWEKVTQHDMDKYINLTKQDVNTHYEIPNNTLIYIVHPTPEFNVPALVTKKNDYFEYYTNNTPTIEISKNEYEGFDIDSTVIYNNYEKFIDKICCEIKDADSR